MREVWTTTTDNPFDFWDQFDDWKRFDEDHGYYTCELVARVAKTNDEFGDERITEDLEDAIDFLVEWDPTGKRIKIEREVEND